MVTQENKVRPSVPREEIFWDLLKDLSLAIGSIPDLKSLAKTLLEILTRAMDAERASLFLFDEEKEGYLLVEAIHPEGRSELPPLLTKEDPLTQHLLKKGKIILYDEASNPAPSPEWVDVLQRMSFLGSTVTVPLYSKGKLFAMINLGRKPSPTVFTRGDKDWLSLVANLSVAALENRKLTEALKRSRSHIQRADRLASLGTLTAALAHELRNPLVAIKTFTQLLPERFDDEEFRRHFLQIVSAEVDRISTLINELLEFARPSGPKVEQENINAILDSILFLVSTGTKKKHIHIVRDFSTSLPPVPIDREQIKQVFLNILINAVEATEENGKIHVRTRLHLKAGAPHIQIEITDTGCGISSEHLESIFHPFFTTKRKGSGLGLSISNQIVQEHKGSIDVESQLNRGSSFYVNLPLHPEGHPRRRDFES